MTKFRKGERVKIAPHSDIFMMGERFGEVLSSGRKWNRVRGERSGRVFRFYVGGDSLESTEPRVTLAKHGDLFCIRSHDGSHYSCLGFDVCEKRTSAYLDWLDSELAFPSEVAELRDNPAPRGTLERYAQYESALALVSQHYQLTKRRCPAELTPQLMGLEGKRVEVTDESGEVRRFTVGKSTGWIPIHLEISSSRSSGGFPAMGPYKTVREVR